MSYDKLEGEIQLEILKYLKLRNIPANRNNAGKVKKGSHWINLGKGGWPDVIACLPPSGFFLGVEIKKPGEELSDKQKEVKAEIEQANGIVIVITSVEELAEELLTLQSKER